MNNDIFIDMIENIPCNSCNLRAKRRAGCCSSLTNSWMYMGKFLKIQILAMYSALKYCKLCKELKGNVTLDILYPVFPPKKYPPGPPLHSPKLANFLLRTEGIFRVCNLFIGSKAQQNIIPQGIISIQIFRRI
jgi:hypothetical protein